MPDTTVWPVSRSVLTRNDGSSSARRWMAAPSFSWSARDLGSMATSITGIGKSIDSSTTGFAGSHNVSPVVVWRSPITATMSPAPTDAISSRLAACIR